MKNSIKCHLQEGANCAIAIRPVSAVRAGKGCPTSTPQLENSNFTSTILDSLMIKAVVTG